MNFITPIFLPPPPPYWPAVNSETGKTLQQWQGGWQFGSAFASYLHVHFAQRPTMLNHWLRAARRAL
ncbi:cobyrinic acid a,c-diamide synthase [Klebsiella pneumoniae]|uniref:Cobyrinic acid a,c-diamide synthase n=1 Tax=Klebsiella pneumoniae TaxID=573 RepID=A0A3S4H748_KLEPN|nr:cobyrinic acid a,c-diamide synthase [Klebsiella pneumoniae]